MPYDKNIISIKSFILRKTAENGFREWRMLFNTFNQFDENTTWADLPDWMILFLCEDSRESQFTIYDLLMGALGLGNGDDFEALPAEKP